MKFFQYLMIAVFVTFSSTSIASHPDDEPSFKEQEPSFKAWLEAFKKEAIVAGISESTVNRSLANVKPIERVVKLDRNQPEFKLTFQQYLDRVAPASRVKRGKKRLAENKELLKQIEKKFGVQPRFLVALWGMETDFGRLTGGFNALDALATLAFEGRRGAYFRKELLNALRIIDAGHIEPEDMKGSWAGAMGQTQFMPSTFMAYAYDFNNDGKINVWTDKADALASGANYLSSVGWHNDQTWGRRVTLPNNFDKSLASLDIKKRISEWQSLGVRKEDGSDLPTRNLEASIVVLDDGEGPAYMVYDNYRSIRDWNRSDNFATSVGILSDRIGY